MKFDLRFPFESQSGIKLRKLMNLNTIPKMMFRPKASDRS